MSVSRYVRKGQRTYHGMTVEEVRAMAQAEREEADRYGYGNHGDYYIMLECRDRAAWYDAVAERMEMPHGR